MTTPPSSGPAATSTSARVEQVLVAGVDAGDFRNLDPKLTARAWLGMHNYTYLWLKVGGAALGLARSRRRFADIFIRGIASTG